jgi:hypothetical protein
LIPGEEIAMETERTETVAEKAVSFVKDVFGIQTEPTPNAETRQEYSHTAPEVTAESAMRLDRNAFDGLVSTDSGIAFGPVTAQALETERMKREADEHPEPKGAFELMAESARREDNG